MSHERLSSAVCWYLVHEPTCGWSGSPADLTWSLPGSAAGQQCSSLSSCVSSQDPLLQTPHLKDSLGILGPAHTLARRHNEAKMAFDEEDFCWMSWSADVMTTKHQWQPTKKKKMKTNLCNPDKWGDLWWISQSTCTTWSSFGGWLLWFFFLVVFRGRERTTVQPQFSTKKKIPRQYIWMYASFFKWTGS